MFTIRKATTDDIELINRMANVVFPDTYRKLMSAEQLDFMMDWMYSPQNLRKQMEEEGHTYYIASQDGEEAGYVSIRPEGEHVFHLQKIYVLPQFQGCHLGKWLFEQAVGVIKKLHPAPCQLRLNVNRYNKAVHFYEHLGMKKVDEGDFHIGHGYYMTDYIMGMDIKEMDGMKHFTYLSPLGSLTIGEERGQIVSIGLHLPPGESEEEETDCIREAHRQLEEYLAGRRKEFNLPLSPRGTEFQQRVWQALCAIPYGQTRTYAEIAAAIGHPKAARAVGMANHRNPILIVIPCHRVIGSNGSLTGYAAGMERKEYLLKLEKERP